MNVGIACAIGGGMKSKTLCQVFAEESRKHGIELRFSKGRKLRLLSYAVWKNGDCYVSHKTTRSNDFEQLARLVEIEKQHTQLPII